MEQPVEKKKRGAQKGRIMSEAQREGLKKGFEALKAKREALKKQKEEKALTKEPKITNDLPTNNQELPLVNPDAAKPVEVVPDVKPEVVENKPDIKRKQKRDVLTKDEFYNFKNELLTQLRPIEKPVEKIIEKPVEKIIEKVVYAEPKLISGSALLDSIFFR